MKTVILPNEKIESPSTNQSKNVHFFGVWDRTDLKLEIPVDEYGLDKAAGTIPGSGFAPSGRGMAAGAKCHRRRPDWNQGWFRPH